MLFAGFIGSADWSIDNLPTPYPVPFGSSFISFRALPCILLSFRSALFRWFYVTTIQTHLQAAALLMGTLLDVYRIRLPVVPPFHPASGVDG